MTMTKRRSRTASTQSASGQRVPWPIAALLAVVALVVAYCSQQSAPSVVPPTAGAVTLPPGQITPITSSDVAVLNVPTGFGAARDFWQILFNAPTGSRDPATYTTGISTVLASAINSVTATLDIAAYEFNEPLLTQAVIAARRRGVRVRIVTDDEDGLADDATTLTQIANAGIPVVTDERSALMHNKFMILDGSTVWTGSWNYTINDTYRNNNNAIVLRSRQAVQNYQAEFNEMFVEGRFGPTSPRNTPNITFTQDGVPMGVYFAPEDDALMALTNALNGAQTSIRFLSFSFTQDEVGHAILARAGAGVAVQGIFETTGSETEFSELRPLLCAGLSVRQDGNPYRLHHKVFIIDGQVVATGSLNFSANAIESNDENLVILQDTDVAAYYEAEFSRRWAEAVQPRIAC